MVLFIIPYKSPTYPFLTLCLFKNIKVVFLVCLAYYTGGLPREKKDEEKSFQAVYSSLCTGCHFISFSHSAGPCWLTFGWLSSPSAHHCYSCVFPSDVLFLPQSLTCSQLFLSSKREESKHASSSEEPQTGEYCQKNNLHNTKAFVSSPLSGRQVVAAGITWLSLWKTVGTEVSSTGKPQKQEDLCLSSKHILWDILFYLFYCI